jgi:hypothetical protein
MIRPTDRATRAPAGRHAEEATQRHETTTVSSDLRRDTKRRSGAPLVEARGAPRPE